MECNELLTKWGILRKGSVPWSYEINYSVIESFSYVHSAAFRIRKTCINNEICYVKRTGIFRFPSVTFHLQFYPLLRKSSVKLIREQVDQRAHNSVWEKYIRVKRRTSHVLYRTRYFLRISLPRQLVNNFPKKVRI